MMVKKTNKDGDKERIVAAAINTKNGVRSEPPPARHHNLIHAEYEEFGHMEKGPQELDCQGFLTSLGRFVDRKEAVKIAIEAGQIEKPNWPPDLYSEDLW